MEKNKIIKFNCIDLHRRIFTFFVFGEPILKNFIENLNLLMKKK